MKATRRLAQLTMAVVATTAMMVSAANLSWNVGDGVWDDTPADPGNWNTPDAVPESGDNVTINREGGATVQFESTNFSSGDDKLQSLTLGGNGYTSRLVVGAFEGIPYILQLHQDFALNVNDGGVLEISGGEVNDPYTSAGWRGTPFNINDGGKVKITAGSLDIGRRAAIGFADGAGHTASLEVSGTGAMLSHGDNDFHSRRGNSTLTLKDDGRLEIGRDLRVGTVAGVHEWNIQGGNLEQVGAAGVARFGNDNGDGTVAINQTGGEVSLNHTHLNENAELNVSGGSWRSNNFFLKGEINQSGNSLFRAHHSLQISNGGSYTVESGKLRVGQNIQIGHTADHNGTLTLHSDAELTDSYIEGGQNYFDIGATSGTGLGVFEVKGFDKLVDDTGNNYGFSQVRVNETGVIRGYGTLRGSYGVFQMNGRIIADGYGEDRTLDMSGMRPLTSTVANTTNKGFYAVDGGKLTLRSAGVAVGNNNYNWGQPVGDATIDLVNSIRFEFTSIDDSGTLSVSLLATDRSDVPDFQFAAYGGALIGVWDVTADFDFDSVDMIFRYDDALAPANEDLFVFHHTGGTWVDITSGTNTTDKLIWADGVTDFSLFAVGTIPEPSTLVLLVLAASVLGLCRRR